MQAAVPDVARIDLGAEVVAPGACHLMQHGSGGENEPSARLIVGLARADRLEGETHLIDACPHGQQLGDFGFCDANHEVYLTRYSDPAVCCSILATRPVQPVWWLAPTPEPSSPLKYS